MAGLCWSVPPPRAELLQGVREGLQRLGVSLRVLASDVLGAEARIDLVAADPDGRITLVLLATDEEDLALVALGLAQRGWVEARLADWAQLAPGQGLRTDGGVRVMLVAPRFSPQALAAVRGADPELFDLVTYRCLQDGAGVEVLLEPAWLGGAPARPGPAEAGPPPGARFRTGLSDADLVVSPEERRRLD